ncbi:MAG: SsrA-binding protein SmpB [Patescibacteria group bacterium]|nr:SsrA-binding protein SmpB [Patescibacteria group bacterium]
MKPIFNKKVHFHYKILEEIEAGIVLTGRETKSIKTGEANISSAYVSIKNNEAYLLNASVPLYKYSAPDENYDPLRSRKLLLKKREIFYLKGKLQQKGLTLVVTKVYTKHNRVKIMIALAKGQSKIDKREKIMKRDSDRKIKQTLKQRMQNR